MRSTLTTTTLFFSLVLGGVVAGADNDIQTPATVLLITSDELEDSWSEFRDWKTRLGKATKVVTVSAIRERYEGEDVQAKIRACVRAHVDGQGTRWVVLGGDSLPGGQGIVPDRDTRHSIHGGRIRYADIPTDLYYVTKGDWDVNKDGVYGDFRDDVKGIEYAPIAAIGRIPVRTAADVAAFTAKVIAYETRYPKTDFAQRMLYTNAVPMANYKADMLWDRYLAPAWKGGSCQKFFANASPWDSQRPGDYDLSPKNWAARINMQTAGKMHMHGHGFLPGWVLERHQSANAGTVAKLTNEDAYLVMTTVSCFTGQFDASADPSITESMLRQSKGGAVAIVTCAREGVPVFQGRPYDPRDGKTQDGTTRLLTRFWMHGLGQGLTTGEALAQAKADLAKDAQQTAGFHWVLSEINLLGDPTLDMRAQDPTSPHVTAPKALAVGVRSVNVKTDAVGLTVCLSKAGEVYAVETTDSNGLAAFTVETRTEGDLLLTISGPSVNAVTRTIRITGKKRHWFK